MLVFNNRMRFMFVLRKKILLRYNHQIADWLVDLVVVKDYLAVFPYMQIAGILKQLRHPVPKYIV